MPCFPYLNTKWRKTWSTLLPKWGQPLKHTAGKWGQPLISGKNGRKLATVPILTALDRPHFGCYCDMAIVTVFEVAPLMDSTTGTLSPRTPSGTWTFTWFRLTKPGAKPEKITFAGTPPIVTVGMAMVDATGLPGDAVPRA